MADGRPIYRVVSPMFWDDPDVRSLDATHQYIALHVLTCRQVTGAGIFRFSLATAGEDMAEVPVSLSEAFGKVCLSLKWRFNEPSKTLYLPTWWKWNPPDSPNHLRGAMKHLPNLPQTPLFKEFASNKTWLAASLHEAFDEACVRLGVRLFAQEQDKEHEPEAGTVTETSLPSTASNADKTSGNGKPKKRRKTKHEYHPDFLTFFEAYPRSVGIAKAYDAWQGAGKFLVISKEMNKPDAVAYLLEAATAFAGSRSGQLGRKTPHPSSWLNAMRYMDDRADWDLSDKPEPVGHSLLIIEDEEPTP